MLEFIFGLIILGIVVFIALKVFHNITMGIVLILLVLFASYLILGSFPDLKDIPIIGQYLPKLPRTTGEAIATIKKISYNIEILSVERDSDNLFITVANTGRTEVSNFTVFVDNKKAEIINNPKDPLKSGEITVIQVDWKEDFTDILIQTDKASITYTR